MALSASVGLSGATGTLGTVPESVGWIDASTVGSWGLGGWELSAGIGFWGSEDMETFYHDPLDFLTRKTAWKIF